MNNSIRRFFIFNSMKNTESIKFTSLFYFFFIIDVITKSKTLYTFSVIGRYIQFYFKGYGIVGVILIYNMATDGPKLVTKKKKIIVHYEIDQILNNIKCFIFSFL